MRNGPDVLLVIALGLALAAAAQAAEEREPPPADALEPIRGPIVTEAAHHDTSPPLFLMAPQPEPPEPLIREPGRIWFDGKEPPRIGDEETEEMAEGVSLPGPYIPPPSLNFLGLGRGFPNFITQAPVPDTNGDVGPNHYVQMINVAFNVFNKDGITLPFSSPRLTNTIWSGFGGGCQTYNDGDGIVLYDSLADRWLISQLVSHPPYLQCIAVSTTGDPTGSWHRYAYAFPDLPDYGKFGVWPDGYYATFNMFEAGTAFRGGKVCAFNRASMLSGGPASSVCFDLNYGGLLPADFDGSIPPPPSAPNRIVALGAPDVVDRLITWAFRVNWGTPPAASLTPQVVLVEPVLGTCAPGSLCVRHPAEGRLPAIGDRLMYRLSYRNFWDHESLVVNHSVRAPDQVTIGVRWYEIRSPSTTPVLFQQGTHWVNDGTDRWMGSTAMDQAGNTAIGFSRSGNSVYPEIRYTGRLVSDPPNTMPQGEGTIFSGTGSGVFGRWGDYSMLAVDPSDDCTFWFTSEYYETTGLGFSTRAGKFKFPNCPPAVEAASNGPVCAGGTLQLIAGGPNKGTYAWTGPNGFTSSARYPAIPNASAAQAGVYTMTHYDQAGNPLEVRSIGVAVAANGGICSDGNACTQTDTCQAGSCVGSNPVTCGNTECTAAGACAPSTGLCPALPAAACEDGNSCTNDACRSGVCASLVSMSAQPAVAVGGPAAVALDDFTYDGVPDVAVAGGDAGTLDVAMGMGDGTFIPLGQTHTGLKPSAIASGDFALNGAHEVAVADALTGLMTIYIVDFFGSNALIPVTQPVDCGAGASAMVAADFDGNGLADLAVANQTENRVTLLKALAPNVFAAWWQGASGPSPTALAAGDLNGDGLADLAVAYGGSDHIAVLLGNHDGNLYPQTGSPYRVGPAPSGVAIGDFDGDGARDIAATSRDGNSVTIFLNRGASGFIPPRSPIELHAGPLSIATADFDRDGRVDLAVAMSDGTLRLLTGAGGGRFALQSVLVSGPSPVSLVARDLNDDGLPDLAIAHRSASTIGIHLSAPDWNQGAACNDASACTMNTYCASGVCGNGVPTDNDGDGHVPQNCPGGDDCNDASPGSWHLPVAVTGLTVAGKLSTNVSWNDQSVASGPGTAYDLATGSLPPLDFSLAGCAQSAGGTSIIDARPYPPVGSGYWYLPRARNACGSGTYGTAQEDALLTACP